jgi:hypothetical protein
MLDHSAALAAARTSLVLGKVALQAAGGMNTSIASIAQSAGM